MAAERKLLAQVAARSNRNGNCATATVDTVALHKLQAACAFKITAEISYYFLAMQSYERKGI